MGAGGMDRVGIVGGGAWGTALATIAAAAGATMLWAHEADVVAAINHDHRNPAFLPGVDLDPAIRAVDDMAAVAACDVVLLVAPAQYLRTVAAALAPTLPAATPVVICAKGIEQQTGLLMSEVVAEILPDRPLALLSGPTFAAEVARGLPTAITLACADAELGRGLVQRLGRPTFRPYLSADVIGAEIGGAVKNVLAIACGIVAGRRLGDNARAALITRGLAEMLRLGRAKGALPETLMGLSGLGDLVLTCTGATSRNYSLGVALGEGRSLAAIQAGRRSVAEGVDTAPAVVQLAARLGVEMPISAAVAAILHGGAGIDDAIAQLLARPFINEA
ncbi:MAG TPA: NAD(P)H-dependent glycerol-3-phosphate dehydrogenase [Candidatus Sulfotelmatobacter sp.]|nr:NAD(P)H-dependent glycerol-3-phosphate dehydrogenase [Candidatus Sulfotelmatobacter sp.]